MTTRTAKRQMVTLIAWDETSPTFFRSSCGRFDVFRSEWNPAMWVAVDWHDGKRCHRPGKASAQAWCEDRYVPH